MLALKKCELASSTCDKNFVHLGVLKTWLGVAYICSFFLLKSCEFFLRSNEVVFLYAVLYDAIVHLADFSSDQFDFASSKTV